MFCHKGAECIGAMFFIELVVALSLTNATKTLVGWLIILGFNATLTAKVISWRSVTHMCFLAFSHQSHRLLFSHASAEVKGENTTERKFASTGYRTHNHQVMSPTRSALSHPGGAHKKVRTIQFLTITPLHK